MTGISDLVSLGLQGTQVMRGWQEVIYQPSPAAGQPATLPVPGDTWMRPLAVNAQLVTSAVVASRFLRYRVLDGDGNVLTVANMSGAIPASTTVQAYGWPTAGGQAGATSGSAVGAIPDMLVKSGWQLQWFVANMDAGDTLTGVEWVVQRFPTEDLVRVAGRLDDIAEHTGRGEHWARLTYERITAWLDGG